MIAAQRTAVWIEADDQRIRPPDVKGELASAAILKVTV